MPIKFNCPACSALIEYDGRSSLFQTCSFCKAPIVVPADVINPNPQPLNNSFEITDPSYKQINIPSEVQTQDAIFAVETFSENDAPLTRIKSEIVNGRKIDAIKLYLETYKVGLKEAKDAVDVLENEMNSPPVNSNTANEISSFILDGIKNELRKGNKINAIKIFREHFEVSLTISKDIVEAIERGENVDLSQFPKNLN